MCIDATSKNISKSLLYKANFNVWKLDSCVIMYGLHSMGHGSVGASDPNGNLIFILVIFRPQNCLQMHSHRSKKAIF